MKRLMVVFYGFLLVLTVVLTWFFVDANAPIAPFASWASLLARYRIPASICYGGIILGFTLFYVWVIRSGAIQTMKEAMIVIGITAVILFFAFPGFSYDVFNYMATAKVAFLYKENPYVVMPIQIPNEPMLAFMHASNKVALYGFAWIALTVVPYLLGFGNLLLTVFSFKFFVDLFYIGTCFLLWKLSRGKVLPVLLFALNPVVIMETLVGGHNDVVMMYFALLSFYLLRKKQWGWSLIAMMVSVGIKFATVFLLTVYIGTWVALGQKREIVWSRVWRDSMIAMLVIFLLSPLREEIYSWYLIWPLAFFALTELAPTVFFAMTGLTVGVLLRFAPFIYTGEWGGLTPLIKKIVTFGSPLIGGAYGTTQKKM